MPDGEAVGGAPLTEPQLRRLLEVGRALVSELDVEAVLGQVLDTAKELTRAAYAALGILDADKQELERFLFTGISEELRREIGPLPRGRGVLGELIRNPAPLRLHDVTEHPRSYGFPPGHPPMKTFLGVPISIRGEAFGNLYLADKAGGRDFDESDQELVLVLAEWAAIAIDNARLYESVQARRAELERAVRGLEATGAIARAVGFETDLDRVLELVVKRGRAMIDASSLLVLLASDRQLRVASAAGHGTAGVIGAEILLDDTLAGSALASGEPERVADLRASGGHGLETIAADARSALVVPLGFRGRGRGVLVAFSDSVFDADAEHVLSSFAASAAIAIATAQSVEAARRRHSIRASEQERTRWARELHDETLQELGGLKVMLETAHQSERSELLERAVATSIEQLDLSIRNLQGLITELRPAALDELGIEPALDALARRVGATTGLDVRTRVELGPYAGSRGRRLAPELESTVYRLAQEALTNTAKHSGAERAEIEIIGREDAIQLTVRDDGGGFQPGEQGEGFGLVGMQERVALVDGELEIESKPGGGTTVRAELPTTDVPTTERPARPLRPVS